MIITKELLETFNCGMAISWMQNNPKYYSLSEKELLDILEAENPIYFEAAKKMFDFIRPQIILQSKNYKVLYYKVTDSNGKDFFFNTEEEASQKINEVKKDLFLTLNYNFTINHGIKNEQGDETWIVVKDLENTEYSENFYVFDPFTGKYVFCKTKEEAKQQFNNIKQSVIESLTVSAMKLILGTSGDTNGDTGWVGIESN